MDFSYNLFFEGHNRHGGRLVRNVGRPSLRHHEIDLSLSAAGVRVDRSEYGDEVVYLAGGGDQAIRIVASDEHTRQGKFVVAVNWMRPLTKHNLSAMGSATAPRR